MFPSEAIEQEEKNMVDLTGLVAAGAGLAMMGGALGTGIAQREVLAAGLGAVVEDDKNFVKALIFAALPETLVILGFVMAFIILGKA